MRHATFCSFALAVSILPTLAAAQDAVPPVSGDPITVPPPVDVKVGDTVIVTQDAELKVGDQVLQTIPAGQGLQVLRVNGDWLWVSRDAAGWINGQFVTPAVRLLDVYTDQIRANPRDAKAYLARGKIWESKGELDIAILDYDEAIRIRPRSAEALFSRGSAWTRKGEYDKAISDYDDMIDGKFAVADAYNSRGAAEYYKRDYDHALADFNEAIQRNPKSASAWYNRGNTRYQRGEFGQAVTDCNEAVRLDPNFASAYLALAGVYANCPDAALRDLKKAVAHAARACELAGWNDPSRLGLLAAVFDATGNADEAIRWQTRAMQSADARLKPAYQARLDIYRSHKRK